MFGSQDHFANRGWLFVVVSTLQNVPRYTGIKIQIQKIERGGVARLDDYRIAIADSNIANNMDSIDSYRRYQYN